MASKIHTFLQPLICTITKAKVVDSERNGIANSDSPSKVEKSLVDNSDVDTTTIPEYKYPEYKSRNVRLDSFLRGQFCWPKGLKQRPHELADAGLFYTGQGDAVICFSCGTGLQHWEGDDVPIEEHSFYCPIGQCKFLNEHIGLKRQEKIHTKRTKSCDSKELTVIKYNSNLEVANNLCTICLTNNANIVFIPCNHCATCRMCAEQIKQCQICRTDVEKAIRVFFP